MVFYLLDGIIAYLGRKLYMQYMGQNGLAIAAKRGARNADLPSRLYVLMPLTLSFQSSSSNYSASIQGGSSAIYWLIAIAIFIVGVAVALRLFTRRRSLSSESETVAMSRGGLQFQAAGRRPLAYLVAQDGRYLPIYSYDRTLGREDLATILPPEAAQYISTRHFRVFYWSGQWYVEDLGTVHGTFLDGVDIRGRGAVPLRPGAIISIARAINLAFHPAQ